MVYLWGYLLIFLAKCSDVTLATIRTIFVVKGKRMFAFCIGCLEILIYLFAMDKVLGDMGDIFKVASYALGFATGNVVGITLEEKLAIGLIIAQVFTSKDVDGFSNYLREHGFGVTVIEGKGKEGVKYILQIVLDRKHLNNFQNTIDSYDSKAFVAISDIKNVTGGYFGRNAMK